MPTTKSRINISLGKQSRDVLAMLAKHEEVPIATKAARLIEEALELDEDVRLAAIADKRTNHKTRFVKDSDAVWGIDTR